MCQRGYEWKFAAGDRKQCWIEYSGLVFNEREMQGICVDPGTHPQSSGLWSTAVKAALRGRYKSMPKLGLISSYACFNHFSFWSMLFEWGHQAQLWEFTSSLSPACVSKRAFYEAVQSRAVNLWFYFGKMKSPDAALHTHICLSHHGASTNWTSISSAKSTFDSLYFNSVWKVL